MLIVSPERLRRSRIFYFLLILFILSIGGFLIYKLQDLILPILIGILSAYICIPALNYLRRKNIPKGLALVILFGFFFFVVIFLGKQILHLIPDEKEKLELRVRLQYRLNELYLNYTGREDFNSEGNFLYEIAGDELTPIVKKLNTFLQLNDQEKILFYKYVEGYKGKERISEKLAEYLRKNEEHGFTDSEIFDQRTGKPTTELKSAAPIKPGSSVIGVVLDALSHWIIMPFVFLFLLIDEGEVKRFFINLVPNRYFEMALTTFENVDKALGKYLRGTLLECSLVGLTIMIGLILIGFDLKAAALIGVLAGITNAIPFLGPIIGLVIGLVYALIVEGIDPILPFLTPEYAALGVVVTVIVAQALDETIYQPVVLGKAVNLHPIVVILGITGGSIIFGFAGMLFAIPTIIIFKVIISTIQRQLKAYFLIY